MSSLPNTRKRDRHTSRVSSTEAAVRLWNSNIFQGYQPPAFLAYALIFLSGLQILAINFETAFLTVKPIDEGFDLTIRTLLDVLLFRHHFEISQPNAADIAILCLLSIYSLFLLFLLAFPLRSLIKQTPVPSMISRTWNMIGSFHLYCLSLPIHCLCFQLATNVLYHPGSTAKEAIFMCVAILCEIVNLTFSSIKIKASLLIKNKDRLASSNKKYISASLLCKIVFSSLNWLTEESERTKSLVIVTIFLSFVFSRGPAALLLRTIPYYDFNCNRLSIIMEAIGAGILSVALGILIFSGTGSSLSADDILVGSILASLVLLKIYISYVTEKRLHLLPKSYAKNSKLSQFETYNVIQQIRFIKNLFSKAIQPDISDKKWQYNLILETGQLHSLSNILTPDQDLSSVIPDKQTRRHMILEFLKKLIESNPRNPLLKLQLASYQIKTAKKIYEPSFLLHQILSSQGDIRFKLSALHLQQKIKDIMKANIEGRKQEIDLTAYFQASETYEELVEHIESQLQSVEKFYNLIEDSTPNALEFLKTSAKIQSKQKKVHKYWNTIPVALHEKKASFCLAYSLYNICINYDQDKGKEYLRKYKLIMRKTIDNYKYNIIDDRTLYDSNNISVAVHGDKLSLGTIVTCSSNIKSHLGYTTDHLIGKNVNILMPSFIGQIHNQLLMKKLDSDEKLFELTHINSFAKDSMGYLVPIKTVVVLYPGLEQGFNFWGVIRPVRTEFDYMLVSENGNIEGYSRHLGEELGLSTKEKYNVNILSAEFAKFDKLIDKLHTVSHKEKPEKQSESSFSPSNRLKMNMRKSSHFSIGNDKHSLHHSGSESEALESENEFNVALDKGRDFIFKSKRPPSYGGSNFLYHCKISVKEYCGKILKIVILERLEMKKKDSFPQDMEDSLDFNNVSEMVLDNVVNTNLNDRSPKILVTKVNHTLALGFTEENELGTLEESPFGITDPFEDKSHIQTRMTTELGIPKKKKPSHFSKNRAVESNKYSKSMDNFDKDDFAARISISSDEGKGRNKSNHHTFAQSSIRSDLNTDKAKYRHIHQMLDMLPFYRYNEAKLLTLFIGIFFIIFCISMWLAYDGAVSSIPKIEGTVEVFKLMWNRTNNLYLMMKELYSIWLGSVIGYPPDTFVVEMQTEMKRISEINAELADKTTYLEPATKEAFYEANVKIFYDGYMLLNDSQEYNVMDSISAYNALVSEGIYYANHSVNIDPLDYQYVHSKEFLFANLFNDILIKDAILFNKIETDIVDKIQGISDRAASLSSVTGGFFAFTTFALIVILYKISRQTISFIERFVNGNYDDDLLQLRQVMTQYRYILSSQMVFEDTLELGSNKTLSMKREHAKSKKNNNKNLNNYGRYKHVSTTGVLLLTLRRFVTIIIFLIAAIIILITANEVFVAKANETLPAMNDIVHMGELAFQAQYTNSHMPLYIFRNDVPIKFRSVLEVYHQAIEGMITVSSASYTNFTPGITQKLNEDICPTINYTLPNCTTIAKGVATQGVLSAYYYTYSVYSGFKDFYDAIPPNPMKQFMGLGYPDLNDNFYVLYYGTVPALSVISSERSAELSEILRVGADTIVKYAVGGLIIAILLVLVALIYNYPLLVRERRNLTKTMMLLPPNQLLRNKYMKEFLLKSSRQFSTFIKNHQEEDTNRYTINHIFEGSSQTTKDKE